MRYLRMLSNSIVAACLATGYVLIVVLQLNPTLPIDPARLAPLAGTVGLFYAVHFTAGCYALLVLRQLTASAVFSPAWISVGVLAWLCALAAAGGSALMWANLATFSRVLDAGTVGAMARGAVVLAATSLFFAVLIRLRRRLGPEPRWLYASILVLLAGSSVAVPVALRGPGITLRSGGGAARAGSDPAPAEGAHVQLIAVDAASLDFIARATAEGRLPNFGRVLDAGAVMHLATIHPTSAEAVWAAAMTGKLPMANGVRSAGIYHLGGGGEALQLLPNYCFSYQLVRFGVLTAEAHTSATLRARPLWTILSDSGYSVGVVGWPLTQPAPPLTGYVVSDTYLRLAESPSGIVDSPGVHPPDLQADVMQAADGASEEVSLVLPASSAALEHRRQAARRTDEAFDRIAQELAALRPPRVTLTRYQSLDPIGHYFLRYADPSAFGDAPGEEHRALGAVLERHYRIVDDAIGRAIDSLGADDLLLVVSGFGMEPMPLGKRAVERIIGDSDLNGTHDSAPDGFLMAYGAPVARGQLGTRASIVDVAPTILYFLGLPVGRDMDGYARTDLFQRDFTDQHPIAFIPSYDR